MHLLTYLVVFLSYFRQTVGGLFDSRGRIEVGVEFWLDNLKEGDSMEDIVLGGDNIKNVRKEISRKDYIYMAQGTKRWRAFFNILMSL
jgi:glycogen debranching enzyme